MPLALLLLLATALIALQVLIGGARPVYALPCYGLIAAAAIGTFALRKTPLVRPNPLCIVTALTLGGYLALRALFSPVPYLARPDLTLALAALATYLVCTLFLSGTQQRFTLLAILMLMAAFHAALGIVQLINQQNFMLLPWIFRPDYGFRASGFLISPNHLATLLGMLGVLTLSICCWSRVGVAARALAFYGFMVCLTGIALTGSRGGYFSTAAGLLLFLALSALLAQGFNRPHFFGLAMATAVLLTAVVAAALYFVVQSEVYEKRLRHVHDPSQQSQLLAPAARQQHHLQPWFGTGAGTFLYYGRQFCGPAVQNDPQHAHHEYLELLAEYGWIGGALFAVFGAAHLAAAITGLRHILRQRLKLSAWTANNELALIAGAICALTIGLVHARRDFTFHLPANALIAAFLFSILGNATVETASRSARVLLPFWMRFLAPLTGVLLLAAALPRLPTEISTERARLALRDHQFTAAEEHARSAMRGDPANPEAAYIAGEALRYQALETGDPGKATELRQQAVTAFEQGLKAFPRDVRLILKLVQVWDDLGETLRSDDGLSRALELAPDSGLVLACCAVHWHRQKQFAKAADFYRRALQLGETQISTTGLRDLERDRAVARGNNAFSEILPDPPEERLQPSSR